MKLSPLDLSPYIQELILMNECIILRGVGGFETHYKNAVLDKNRKMMIPPSKEIVFRGEWIQDNGVLERHMADSLKISKEKASAYIDDFVQEFYNTLKETGTVRLEGIGLFSFDDKSNLHFEEIKDANYLADSFGLEVLDFDIAPRKVEKTSEEPLTPVQQPKRKLTALYITIGVLLLVISVTLIILLSEGGNFELFDFGRRLNKNQQLVFGNRSETTTDTTVGGVGQKLDNQTDPRVALAYDQAKEENASDDGAEVVYYVIAGSFKTMKNAEIARQELIDEGFKAEIVPMGENIRVVVGTFYNRKDALYELRRLRGQIQQSLWLLTKKQSN